MCTLACVLLLLCLVRRTTICDAAMNRCQVEDMVQRVLTNNLNLLFFYLSSRKRYVDLGTCCSDAGGHRRRFCDRSLVPRRINTSFIGAYLLGHLVVTFIKVITRSVLSLSSLV
jgi:hypothetical protein